MKKKSKEQRPNEHRHRVNLKRLEDRNVIDVGGNLDIYNEIVGLKFSSRETSSSRYNGACAD